tara:strand:+ start:4972 stop:5628 length:657 start_codon:yes stop_codon:yes gene_type:complete
MAIPQDTVQSYTTYYTLYLTDQGEAAEGLTPVVESFWGLPSKMNYVGSPTYFSPAIEEIGGGFYFFSIDWSTFDPSGGINDDDVFLVKIETDPLIVSDSERIISLRIEKTDSIHSTIIDKVEEHNIHLHDHLEAYTGGETITDVKNEILAAVDEIKKDTYRILEIEQGSWKIEDNQLKLYPFEGDTSTPIVKFDLFDRDGNPTEGGPFSREPNTIKPL